MIIVNITSTTVGSKATYQCRNGSTDVYTTQCTSHGVWDPHPLSSLDCSSKEIGTQRTLRSLIHDITRQLVVIAWMVRSRLRLIQRLYHKRLHPSLLVLSVIISVTCEELESTDGIIILNMSSTALGSKATYQCRDDPTDVYTTQCTSHGVWDPHPLSSLDCTESTNTGKL